MAHALEPFRMLYKFLGPTPHCCCCCTASVVSDSVRPRRQKPTRLPHPWNPRQEHWNGLPFPSPMHESEKWKWSRSVVSDSWRPHGLQATRLLRPLDFPGKSTGMGRQCLLLNAQALIVHLPCDPFTPWQVMSTGSGDFSEIIRLGSSFFSLCL